MSKTRGSYLYRNHMRWRQGHNVRVANKTKQNKKRRRSPALPETPFLLLLISVLDFLPKLTNTQTSHTRDSFCLLLNYINIKLNNMICLWDLFSLFHFAGSLHFHAVWYSNIWIYHNLFTKHLGAFFVSAVRSNDFYVFFFFLFPCAYISGGLRCRTELPGYLAGVSSTSVILSHIFYQVIASLDTPTSHAWISLAICPCQRLVLRLFYNLNYWVGVWWCERII